MGLFFIRSRLPRNRYRSGPDGGQGVLAPVWKFAHLDKPTIVVVPDGHCKAASR